MNNAPSTKRRLILLCLTLIVAVGMAGCDLLEVENPNTLVEEQLANPASIDALANGAEATVISAASSIIAPQSTVSDEITWVGSYDSWKRLNFGEIYDPLNPEVETAYADASEARWTSAEAVERIEAFRSEGLLGNRGVSLVRAYLYAGIIHTAIADAFDDFVVSDKQEAGSPVGEESMAQFYTDAIEYLDKGVALAQEIGASDWETRLLAVRARAKFSQALWDKLNPTVDTADPLVQSDGAVADAQAVLDRVSDDWTFVVDISSESAGASSRVGAQINNRGELRFSDEYVQVTSDNKTVEAVTLTDKIDDVPAPALVSMIDAFLGAQEFIDFTVVSAAELHLIVAEAALAANDGSTDPTFEQHINAIRAAQELTAYSGQIPALDMLVHSRRVNLFLQGRRLADQYRFDLPSAEWTGLAESGAFFPISDTERRANPNVN